MRETEALLAPAEHLIPESRLEVVLELGQIHVHAAAATVEARGALEREQAEVEQRTRDRVASHAQVSLL